jgi:hypothetical protein
MAGSPPQDNLMGTTARQRTDNSTSPGGSEASSSSVSDKGKAADRDYPTAKTDVGSANESESASNDVKGKDRAAGRSTIATGIGAGEAFGRMGRSRFAHPTPGILRTGLDLPNPKDDITGCMNSHDTHGPMVQNNHRIHRYCEYRVQFSPSPKEHHQHFRTVHIGNLPTGITLKVLMGSVRGGDVLKATLLNTIPITGSPSALITFIDPCGAANYVAFAGLHPIRYMGTLATITMVNTPTFPMSRYIVGALKALNCTRVLRLGGIPLARATLLQDLDLDRAARLGLIEGIRVQNEFSAVLTFASIEMALHTYNAFQTLQCRNAERTFLPDPCAEPLEHLFKRQAELCGHFEDTLMQGEYDDNESNISSPGDADDEGGMSDYEPGSNPLDVFHPLTPGHAREEPPSIMDEEIIE